MLTALESFNQALRCEDLSDAKWVEDMDMDLAAAWSFDSLPLGKQEEREHQVILFAEGGAPYDHAGLVILEIPALAGSSFANRAPETERPSAWDGGSDHGDSDDDDEA